MVVVHLARMGNDRDLGSFGNGVDLLRRRDAANPVGIILQDADGLAVDELGTADHRKLVLAAGNRHDVHSIEFGIPGNVIRNHGLF